mgnify:CR=1 FL=1
MKKCIALILSCMMLLVCLTGCKEETPENASSVNADVQVPAPTLHPDEVYSQLSNEKIAWGLKKVKGEKPEVPDSIIKTLDTFDGIYLSKSGGKNLYLTFDEGYENGYSGQILDVLQRTQTPAAFFITGDYLKNESELVARMVNEGHIVGNHTQNHPSMPGVSDIKSLAKEITELDDSFFALTGQHMRYLRPPKGEFSEKSLAVSKDLGYRSVFWSFAYADWEKDKTNGAQYAYDHVMPYLHDGAIILLHAVSKDNADALEKIITDAKAAGYTFKSLDEL